MTDDIKFWRGKPLSQMDADELRVALAEVFRKLEQLDWLCHQQKIIIERGSKKPGRRPKKKLDIDETVDA